MRGVFEEDLEVVLELEGLNSETAFLHTHNIKPLQIRSILLGHPMFPPLEALKGFMLKLLLTFLHPNHTTIKQNVQKSLVLGY